MRSISLWSVPNRAPLRQRRRSMLARDRRRGADCRSFKGTQGASEHACRHATYQPVHWGLHSNGQRSTGELARHAACRLDCPGWPPQGPCGRDRGGMVTGAA